MDSKDVALGAFVVTTLVFASIAAIEYSRGPSPSTATSTSTLLSTTTTTETTTTISTTISTTSVVSVSTVTAAKSVASALSVRVNRPDYTTNQTILVNGSVFPAPNFPLNVTLIVTSPEGVIAIASSPVSNANGSYSYTLLARGPGWVVGVYAVTAICVDYGVTETANTQFTFAVPV